MAAFRSPAPLSYHALIWRQLGADSVAIHPIIFLVGWYWRGRSTDHGIAGQVQFVTDEVEAAKPVYPFEARALPCEAETGSEHGRAGT